MNFSISPEDCMSTHGGAGYALGSYFDGDDIICGLCGTRITNPPPTGKDADGDPKFGSIGIKKIRKRKENIIWKILKKLN